MKRLLAICLIAVMTALPAVAMAQASTRTFTKLMDVQELWEEEDYPAAVAILEELIESTRGRPHDYALANQYLAHTAVIMDEMDRARPAIERALTVGEKLPVELFAELKMFYGQLLVGDEEFELAKQVFDEWFAINEEEPRPQQLFSIGYANYRSGHLNEALDYVSQAIDLSTKKPPDSWLRLQYQVLFDLDDFDGAKRVAVELLNREPNEETYWRLLASHHLRLEDYPNALATTEVANTVGVLQEESDLRRIATLYGQLAAPERAARNLAAWVDEERVEADAKTWRQLGDLWMLARERDNAKNALWKSVELEPDPQALEFLASIHFEDAEWEQSYTAFEHALRVIDPEADADDVHRLELLTGITAMRAGRSREAREFLLLAEESEDLRPQVRSLLRELDRNN